MQAGNSSSTDALTQQAIAALSANRLQDAYDFAKRALATAPGNPHAHLNVAVAARALRRLDDASAAVAEARRLAPSDIPIAYNLALIELSRGNWEQGWRFLDTRLMIAQGRRQFRFLERAPKPWRGEDLSGRSLQILWEEGYGDTIQMLRYVQPLAEAGCAVYLDVQPPLVPLVQGMAGVAGVSGSERDEGVVGIADFSLPALSLPRRFDEQLRQPPRAYLAADPARSEKWAARLAELPRPWTVVQWQGSRSHPLDRVRSIPVEAFLAGLAGVPGTLISVQKGETCPPGVIDAGAEIADFADSAAIIALADRTVTVDTAAAHLAGALGRPVHLLNPVHSDWRWLSPQAERWYPALSIHHQAMPNDWSGPLAAVVKALQNP